MENNVNTAKVSTGTIVRTVCLFLALVNQLLSASGHSVLPIENEQVEVLISTVVTVGTALRIWWKNNSFTNKEIAAHGYLAQLEKSE